MKKKIEVKINAGGSLLTTLGVLFVVLKLTGVVDWPWWMVLSPIWGGVLLCALVVLVLMLVLKFEERAWRK